MTEEQITCTEKVTKGQAENPLWFIYKKGRITASNFGKVIRSIESGRKPPVSLFKTLLGEYTLDGVASIEWGKAHESVAVQAWEEDTGLRSGRSGFFLHPSGALGASPDRLVGEGGIIEAKCPFTHRDKNIGELAVLSKDFILAVDTDNKFSINTNHNWYHQIQGQLALSRRQHCWLIIWTTVDVVCISIKADSTWQERYVPKLITFYRNHLLPVIFNGGV